ncbi:MAG: c-type cytochrome [Anaerolineales bacterium]|nr:c-type cytochrome [Anaerolineales bacterium]
MAKRFSSLAILLTAVFVLAACGGAPEADAGLLEAQAETAVSEVPVTDEVARTEEITETAEDEIDESTEAAETETEVATQVSQPAAQGVGFTNDILPIFQANCTRCHGSSRQQGGLRLDSYAAVILGSEDGAVVLAGDAANSLLVQLVEAGRMPRNSARLTESDIQAIVDWINAGALDN